MFSKGPASLPSNSHPAWSTYCFLWHLGSRLAAPSLSESQFSTDSTLLHLLYALQLRACISWDSSASLPNPRASQASCCLLMALPFSWSAQVRDPPHFLLLPFWGRQNNGPPKAGHILIPDTCGCFRLQGKGEFRLQMDLKLSSSWPWDKGISLDRPGGLTVITKVFKCGNGRQKSRVRWCHVKETWQAIAGFEYRRPQAKECEKPPEAREGRQTDYPLEPPNGIQPCRYLDDSPVRPVSDWWPPVLFQAIRFVVICYRINRKLYTLRPPNPNR